MAHEKLTIVESRPFAGSKVDRVAGTISDVLICGTSSQNGNDYPWGTKLGADSVKAYEGRPVNVDHARNRETAVSCRIGWFSNVHAGEDGRPRGTFNVLKSHPLAESVFEAAERNPTLYGFSHVADCDVARGSNGRKTVESIARVYSIDLVADPATTKSIFESVNQGKPMPKKLSVFVKEHAPKLELPAILKLKTLLAMEGMSDMDMPDMAEDGTGDAGDPVDTAFKTAINSFVEQYFGGKIDFAAMLKKLKAIGKAHGDITGNAVSDDDTPDTPAEPDGDEAKESRRKSERGLAIYESLEACTQAGYTASPADLEIIAATAQASRPALIKRLKESAAPATAKASPAKSPERSHTLVESVGVATATTAKAEPTRDRWAPPKYAS